MDERELLLKAILENPAEDAPRVMYADWLKEHDEPLGRERGEFIRYQLAYELHAQEDGDPVHTCEEEYPYRAGVWPYAPWPDSVCTLFKITRNSVRVVIPIWRRGFIERVTCSARDWWKHQEALRWCHPISAATITAGPDIVFDGKNRCCFFELDRVRRKNPSWWLTDEERDGVKYPEVLKLMLDKRFPGVTFSLTNL